MSKSITAKCDDCGLEIDHDDLYDSPWADNKVRCVDCFLKFCGYDLNAVNEWSAKMTDEIRRQLTNVIHDEVTSDALARWNNYYLNEMTAKRNGLDSIEYWRDMRLEIRLKAWRERCATRCARIIKDNPHARHQ